MEDQMLFNMLDTTIHFQPPNRGKSSQERKEIRPNVGSRFPRLQEQKDRSHRKKYVGGLLAKVPAARISL